MNDNKRIAAELFARFSEGDIPGALGLMTEDVAWRLPGKPELTRVTGTFDKPRLERLFQRMFSRLESGLSMTVVGSIAEGDRVAVEVVSSGDLKNGRKYRQEYHFMLGFRDGKIATVHEYLDTHHAHDVWVRE